MKFYDAGLIVFIVVASLAAVIAIGNYVYDEYWPDDNPVEEGIEKELERRTGVDIDLTPGSPEKK